MHAHNRGVSEDETWVKAPGAATLCVIAHGAGNDSRHPFFNGISEGLASQGISSMRFDFPYMRAGRRAPDRPPALLEAWREALDSAGRRASGLPLIASGKSLGGRMASLLAAEEGESFPARGLVFFGYPLHAPGRFDSLRDEHLRRVAVPMLFIEGTADPLARFDLIGATVASLGERARLATVEGGDHSFRVRGAKRPDEEIGRDLGAVAAGFIREVVA